MAKSAKVFHGARAKVFVKPTENGTPQLVGIFDSCSYSVNIGAEAIHILGRFSPDEITQTSYEAVQVSCSGFRIIGNGAKRCLPATTGRARIAAIAAGSSTPITSSHLLSFPLIASSRGTVLRSAKAVMRKFTRHWPRG